MHVAFYAPLKPPDWPVPSGDRQIARMFISALHRAGHRVSIASRLRSFDRTGNATRQRRIADIGEHMVQRLERRYREPGRRPDLWPRPRVRCGVPRLRALL